MSDGDGQPLALSTRSARHRAGPGWPWQPVLTLLLVAVTLLLLPPPPPAPVVIADQQPPHQWQPGRLRIGVDAAYAPFASLENGQYRGHDIELARELAGFLGLEPEFVNIPYDGLYDALRVSRIDIIVSALPLTSDYDGQALHSRPYFEAGEVLIVPIASMIRGPSDLVDRQVGAELGSLGDQTVRRLRASLGLRPPTVFDSPAAGVAALQAGSLDALVIDRVSALGLVRSDPTLRLIEEPLQSAPYTIAMPFDAPGFAERVNGWLSAAEADGRLARLANRHGLGDR